MRYQEMIDSQPLQDSNKKKARILGAMRMYVSATQFKKTRFSFHLFCYLPTP
jgi:hypothetical protein